MTGAACVRCGGDATEGSLQHPYCLPCFKVAWSGDYSAYASWLDHGHLAGVGQADWRLLVVLLAIGFACLAVLCGLVWAAGWVLGSLLS